MAPAPGKRLTTFEHQPLREHLVGRALAPDVVAHELDQLLLEAPASRTKRRVHLVGAEVGSVTQGELVRPHGELQLPAELVRPPFQNLLRRLVAVGLADVGEEPLEQGLGAGEPLVEQHHLGLAG